MTNLDNLHYQAERIKLVLAKTTALCNALIAQSGVAINAYNTNSFELEVKKLESMINDTLAVLP